ncbi:MAG TPA: GTPase Era [Clostridia bacterium]|nr:GTPase Era [Clostridia bacterium]HRX43520.1 GTPase Era [Clostridia bacterium]
MAFKSGFIAVVGRPNVGKSTLINTLAGKKVSIISEKPQTTRNMVRAIITNENSQLILMDTPGIHKPKSKLGEFMVKRAVDSINDADGVIFVVEASDLGPGKTDSMIMERLRGIKPPVILVVNKCDAASEERILNTIASFSSNMEFHEVVPVSALNGDNTDVVLDIARKLLPEGMMYFDGEDYTDQPERTIAAEYIREKILLLLRDEIPHGTGVEITKFHDREDKDIIDIDATIFCERKSHKGILIGKNGSMLKKIGSMARADLQALFGIPVFLQLWVKVKEDWRNTNSVLKDLGYKE